MLFPMSLMASPQGVPRISSTIVGTSAVQALAANPYRGYLIMQNQGTTGSCLMSPVTPLVSPDGILISAGQNYEMQGAFVKSAINFQCDNTGNRIVFIETNF